MEASTHISTKFPSFKVEDVFQAMGIDIIKPKVFNDCVTISANTTCERALQSATLGEDQFKKTHADTTSDKYRPRNLFVDNLDDALKKDGEKLYWRYPGAVLLKKGRDFLRAQLEVQTPTKEQQENFHIEASKLEIEVLKTYLPYVELSKSDRTFTIVHNAYKRMHDIAVDINMDQEFLDSCKREQEKYANLQSDYASVAISQLKTEGTLADRLNKLNLLYRDEHPISKAFGDLDIIGDTEKELVKQKVAEFKNEVRKTADEIMSAFYAHYLISGETAKLDKCIESALKFYSKPEEKKAALTKILLSVARSGESEITQDELSDMLDEKKLGFFSKFISRSKDDREKVKRASTVGGSKKDSTNVLPNLKSRSEGNEPEIVGSDAKSLLKLLLGKDQKFIDGVSSEELKAAMLESFDSEVIKPQENSSPNPQKPGSSPKDFTAQAIGFEKLTGKWQEVAKKITEGASQSKPKKQLFSFAGSENDKKDSFSFLSTKNTPKEAKAEAVLATKAAIFNLMENNQILFDRVKTMVLEIKNPQEELSILKTSLPEGTKMDNAQKIAILTCITNIAKITEKNSNGKDGFQANKILGEYPDLKAKLGTISAKWQDANKDLGLYTEFDPEKKKPVGMRSKRIMEDCLKGYSASDEVKQYAEKNTSREAINQGL